MHVQYLPQYILQNCLDILRSYLPTEWVLRFSFCRASYFGDPIDTCRYVVSILNSTHNLEYINQVSPTGYGVYIRKTSIDSFIIDNLTILEAEKKDYLWIELTLLTLFTRPII